MSTKQEYKIRVVTKDDTEELLDHLHEFFFKNEPMNNSVGLCADNSRCVDLEKYCLKVMFEGVSYVAVTDSNKIVSANLNKVCFVDELLQSNKEEEEYSDPKFEIVGKFLKVAGENGTKAIIEKFPDCKKLFDIKVLSTDFEWRGKGIAGALVEVGRKAAYEKGCDLIRIDCSSYYSARVAQKLGFEQVYELLFDDYKEDGKTVFKIPHPHTSATTFVQKTVRS